MRQGLPGAERLALGALVGARRCAGQQRLDVAVELAAVGELAQGLAPGPQAGGTVVLRAPARRHAETALARRGHGPGDEPRLADAGLTDEEGGRGRARLGAGQHVQQGRLLGLAADRRPPRRRTDR